MTRTLSMPSPRSQTAFTNRSTSTVVLPVPAPAETKTTPGSSIAATCWPEGVVLMSAGSCTSSRASTSAGTLLPAGRCERRRRACGRPRAGRGAAPRRPVPEVGLGNVVRPLQARHRVLASVGADETARLPRPGEATVEATERLHADEIAERKDVERDLELLLRLDVAGAVRSAELVVLDDPACAEGVGVHPVDLPGDGEAAELEAALELDRGRARPEADLEAARHELEAELELLLEEVLQVARKGFLELEPLEVGDVEADAAGDRLYQAFPQEDERLVQAVGLDSVRSEPLRQPAVEAVERLVGDAAAHASVEDGVDLLRGDHPLEEPHGRAVEEPL